MLKPLLLSAILLFSLVSTSVYAKIWRVNNNAGIKADFTTLQDAHDGAKSGDTLHLEGSPTTYGSLKSTKKLIILGTGYFLDENLNLQALRQSSQVDNIQLGFGSTGTVIMGLDFRNHGLDIYVNDVVIRRNKFLILNNTKEESGVGTIYINRSDDTYTKGASNIIISQNYGVVITTQGNYTSTDILITNNYITYPYYYGEETTNNSLNLNQNTVAIVQNNIFRRGKITAYKSNFTNNIMVNGFFEGTDNLLSNNLSNKAQFTAASKNNVKSNKDNISIAAVFVGSGTNISTDAQWKLKAGSPALGAGFGSTAQKSIDAGMFSGLRPYVLSGLPPIPVIYSFENQPIGSNADPIDVTIKVKSVGN